VAPRAAPVSFSRARGALSLAEPDHPLVVASERTGQLLLRSEPGLSEELIRQRLAPLEGLTPAARRRLTVTLRAWLAEQGRLGQMAARLSVHPQTARYRINRLRELFGSTLDDPDGRFWLELALRARDARSPAQTPRP
jgi:DNA-binding PucR family transcriptional regulator